jgi:RHS repeat-associated protein
MDGGDILAGGTTGGSRKGYAEIYNYFRDYDPSIGRYVQSDPLGLAASYNTFAYVGSSPVGALDPMGLWTWGDPVPQGVTDAFVGFGDSVSLGMTSVLRDALDIDGGVHQCSTAYAAGAWAGIFYGGWRLAYAGAAKAGAAWQRQAPKRARFAVACVEHLEIRTRFASPISESTRRTKKFARRLAARTRP